MCLTQGYLIDKNRIPVMPNKIEIKNLSVEYYSRKTIIPALCDVSMTLKKGECAGVVGESGCGKSTLALSILDIIDRSDGAITGGVIKLYLNSSIVDITKIPLEQKRNIRGKYISLILQDPYNTLNPVIKIGEQLKEAYLVHNPSAGDVKEKIKQSLVDVHLNYDEKIINSYPHQLSGGMLQRISIAAALINDPEILIADEPTSNLDVTIQKKIVENIASLQKKYDLSVIFITHNLNLVSGFADTMFILYAGRVVESGPTECIFKEPAHPYTRALLDALPDLKQTGKKILPISGTVPDLSKLPKGCSFAPRCAEYNDRCVMMPDLKEISQGHFVRCIMK